MYKNNYENNMNANNYYIIVRRYSTYYFFLKANYFRMTV